MERYIDPTKIISLLLKAKGYLVAKRYQISLNDEYSIDTYHINLQKLEYIRILIKVLEYEFALEDDSDITYDIYLKLIKIIDDNYSEIYLLDDSLQISNDRDSTVIINYYNTTNRFRSVYLVDENDLVNVELTTDLATGAFQIKARNGGILFEITQQVI